MKRIKILFIIGVLLTAALLRAGQPLNLNDCIEQALAHNLELQQSELNVKQAGLSARQSWAAVMPNVSANASASNCGPLATDFADEWDWSYGGSVSQTLYKPGLYSNISLARAREASTDLYDASLEDQIRASVETVYYQILTSDTLIAVYEANIQLSNAQIEKMQRMVELGMKRESDLLKSEVQRGTFEAQLIREIENFAAYRRSLNLLMGRESDAAIDIVPIPVEYIDVPDYADAETAMMAHNPGLQRLAKAVEIEKLSLRISKEAFLPSASASYSWSKRNDLMGGSSIESDQVSLRLSVDIFDGFNKSINVQKSQVSVSDAQIAYDAAARDLAQSLQNQYNALNTQNKLIQIHQTNLNSARKDLEVVREQYAAGFSTVLDLTDAQLSVLESEISLLGDFYARKRIESEVYRLTGLTRG